MPQLFGFILLICSIAAHANDIAPEPASALTLKQATTASKAMVVTANPYATHVATRILEQGGNAMDAAVAAQLTLAIVEPQASGIGGGGFLLYWDAAAKKLHSYDGRETAPSSAKPDDFLINGKPMSFMQAVKSERAIGVPGLLDMLWMAHQNHSNDSENRWAESLALAESIAGKGFNLSQRLHDSIAYAARFNPSDEFKKLYFKDGKPYPVGEVFRNPNLSGFLRELRQGYTGHVRSKTARDLHLGVAKNRLSIADYKDYVAIERSPICGHYRDYKICSMPPPSSGGSTLLQSLKLLEGFELKTAYDPHEMHLILEAQKLAFADRNHYIADPDFIDIPLQAMLADDYVAQRRPLINPSQASAVPYVAGKLKAAQGVDNSYDAPSTTHLSIVDAQGNAVSLTSSVEHSFGSSIISPTHGIVMNNQLTDFAFTPEADGLPVANRMEAYKRPRSSMSPTMVFDKNDKLLMVLGSPGGSGIIGYVLKTLIAVLDWKLPLQEAINRPHFLQKNKGHAVIEATLPHQSELEALGHRLKTKPLTSGIHAIMIQEDGSLTGAADPRREGTAQGF